MTTAKNTATTAPAWEMRVDVRSKKTVLATNLTLDEAVAFLESNGTANLAVVLPSGSLINAGTSFHSFVRTLKGAQARIAARA